MVANLRSGHVSLLAGLLIVGSLGVPGAAGQASDESSTTRPTTRPATLTLRVVDAGGGEPIAGAAVERYLTGSTRIEYEPLGETGADGTLAISASTPTQFLRLRVTAEGHPQTVLSWQDDKTAETEKMPWRDLPESYTLRLRPGVRIGGTVQDERRRPVPRAIVRFTPYHTSEDFNEQDLKRNQLPTTKPATQPVTQPAIRSWPRESDDSSARWTRTDEHGRWSWPNVHRLDRLSIDAYSDEHVFAGPTPPLDQLTGGATVLNVKAGVRVEGVVTDADGRPVDGARVWASGTGGGFDPTDSARWTRTDNDQPTLGPVTDADGRYLLAAMRPDVVTIYAAAKGHGPTMGSVQLPADAVGGRVALNLSLVPEAVLEGRVVGPDGEPVKKAYIRLERWRGRSSALRRDATTGEDGRFRIDNLPPDAMAFSVWAEDYDGLYDHSLTPSVEGEPQEIVLKRRIMVRGRVTDARTGEPIPAFRVVAGYALRETRPVFYEYQNQIPSFTDGQYDMTVNGNPGTKRTVVRIEAAGYRPVVSEPLAGGQNTFDAQLEPAGEIAATVLSPDGTPAAGAQVIAALPGHQVSAFDGAADLWHTPATTTNANGQFTLSPQAGEWELLILHNGGYLKLPMRDSARVDGETAEITLKPWSGIAGTFTLPGADGKPAGGVMINVDAFRHGLDPSARLLWRGASAVEENGAYQYGRLPDFDGRPVTVGLTTYSDGTHSARSQTVRLRAGETTRVDALADAPGSRTAVGHIYPESTDAKLPPGVSGSIVFYAADLPAPSESPADPDEAVALAKPVYSTQINPDGTFRLPGLPPGKYSVQAAFCVGPDVNYGGAAEVTIPDAGEGAREAEIGGIPVGIVPATPEQVQLPAFVAQRYADGTSIRREDLMDRWTLLLLYAACDGTTAARLDQIEQVTTSLAPLVEQKQLSLLAIATDRVSCGLSGVPVRPELLGVLAGAPWEPAYLDPAQVATLTRVGVREWPWMVLVGPDGQVQWFGAGLVDAETAVREHLTAE